MNGHRLSGKAWRSSVVLLGLLLPVFASLGTSASVPLYTAAFDSDLPLWTLEGAWHMHDGVLVTSDAPSGAWMGRRDWRNYVVDARISVSACGRGAVMRLIGRRQRNGDAFALELDEAELRLVVMEGENTRLLARQPAAGRLGSLQLVRLGLFEDTLIGQLDNDEPLTASISPDAAGSRRAGQVGVFASGMTLSIESFQVVSLASPVLPRSRIRPDPGYLAPRTKRTGGAQDIMLIYTGHYSSGAGEWDSTDAMPYLAYLKYVDGQAQFEDWFFDTLLFLGLKAPSGRAFDSPARAAPAKMEDWQWYLDAVFQEKRNLGAFDEAVRILRSRLDDPGYRAKVIIMIPHAMAQQRDFGDVDADGVSEDSSPWQQGVALAEEGRWKAVKWYVDEAERRWREAGYAHLELVGYYWLDEHLGYSGGLSPDALVRRTSDYIHDLQRRLYWIPYFQAARYDAAYEIGFDCVIMQPNYMFDAKTPRSRLAATVETAKRERFGIEIEADGSVLNSVAGRERYLDYLRAGVTYGYMREAVHAYYQGAKVLLQAAHTWDPAIRAIYDATYAFVKGTFDEQLPED